MKFFTSEYTEKNARYWAVQREFGRWKWVLFYWVCGFGGASFMAKIAFDLVFSQDLVFNKEHLTRSMVTSLLTGLLLGLWSWRSGEKAYTQFINEKPEKVSESRLP
jgi:hypothetical protein